VSEVIERPAPVVVGHRYVLPYAPPMPDGFYGSVTYQFQGGRVVLAVVEEKIRPS
jgi:hypothetical protein